ncbi:MAG TPA: YdbH domain-containing protein, partial [Candidatus Omnitrophota bacterium]|nr:YdbH domain-containing protein [Candidatus Omnitrophota bacterium]
MKRFIFFIIVFALLIAGASVSVRPAIIRIAKKQIGEVFIEGKVSIENSRFSPLRGISLLGVRIRREGIYDLSIGEIRADYDLASLWRKRILKILLKNAKIQADLAGKNISEFRRYVRLGPDGSVWSIENIALSEVEIDIRSKDIELEGRGSAEMTLASLHVRSADLALRSLRVGKLILEDGSLALDPHTGLKAFRLRAVRYDKVRMENLSGLIRQEEKDIRLDGFSAQAFNGQIKGDAVLTFGELPEYLARLTFVDLNLEGFIDTFELSEKFQMSGLIGGRAILKGKGADVEVLSGDFETTKTGGTLVIKDPRLLENIAKGSGQSLDILVESFRNYHYNTGTVALSLDQNDL